MIIQAMRDQSIESEANLAYRVDVLQAKLTNVEEMKTHAMPK